MKKTQKILFDLIRELTIKHCKFTATGGSANGSLTYCDDCEKKFIKPLIKRLGLQNELVQVNWE